MERQLKRAHGERRPGARRTTLASDSRIEKFPVAELAGLRTELLQSGVDSWQAAELVTSFLSGRGYGVDPAMAREVVLRLEAHACSFECMQKEFERVAWVM